MIGAAAGRHGSPLLDAVPAELASPACAVILCFREAPRPPFGRTPSGSPWMRPVNRLRAKLETLNLSGGGLRQLRHELDPARIFIRCEPALDMLLQRQFQSVAGRAALFEHDERRSEEHTSELQSPVHL